MCPYPPPPSWEETPSLAQARSTGFGCAVLVSRATDLVLAEALAKANRLKR